MSSYALLKLLLIAIPAWCFAVLLWSMANALIDAGRWWLWPLLCLGLCVPSALTAEYVWRKRLQYSSIASRTAVFILVATSIVVFTYTGYAVKYGSMGGWELLLWIFVSMIQLLIYGALIYVCDRESWNK